MAVMGVWAFILCTGTDDMKQKKKKPWNNAKQIFPEQKTKKPLSYIFFVQYTKFWLEIGIH